MTYRAPVSDIAFALTAGAGLDQSMAAGQTGDLSDDLLSAILDEAGKFASDVIAPLNRGSDQKGAALSDGHVTTSPGWQEAYQAWCAGGWSALTGDVDHGGQGLPTTLSVATTEMWNAASASFAIGPILTMGSIEAIEAHASAELKGIYLDKLISGEWMGTMNLTEPQAGSDLNALTARAEPQDDGTYRIFGTKIFITYGEHDLTDNIVHLVLARLPDAPAGTRGISLFIVPKFLVNDDGSLGARNDAYCVGLEHKLGLHGSPTATMQYGDNGGAIGYLLGEENKGLACMFTMMNNARLMVGIQGVAVAEAATQHAVAYASERKQGRAPGWDGDGMAPIIAHPDVKRMLLSMRAQTQAARAICYNCAAELDKARYLDDADARKKAFERASLLTPLAKAYSTDIGTDVTSLGVQVHGGMGYIEETGAAQFYRDARIFQIYEGTNGIQAIDLLMRKLPLSNGETAKALIADYRAIAARAGKDGDETLARCGESLTAALDDLEACNAGLTAMLTEGKSADALAVATPYLRVFSLVAGAAYLTQQALAAASRNDQPLMLPTARFFADHHLSETAALCKTVLAGAGSVSDVDWQQLAV